MKFFYFTILISVLFSVKGQDTLIIGDKIYVGKITKEDDIYIYFKNINIQEEEKKIPKNSIAHYSYYIKTTEISQAPLISIEDAILWDYCEITFSSIYTKDKSISINFGKFYTPKNEIGENVKFTNIIDALNYMGKFGWELIQVYDVETSPGNYEFHYLFKRPRKK